MFSKMNYPDNSKLEIDFRISLLPIHFQNKILKYATLQKQQQRLEGLKLLEKIFLDNNLSLNDLQYNKNSKPFVNDKVDFSLSYSNNNVVLGFIKNGKIGVDLEEIKPINLLDFSDYFTETELSIITNSNNIDTNFCKFWTRKEAVSKALGLGAFLDFKSFEVIYDNILVKNKHIKISSELISENYWLSIAIIQ